MFYSCSVQNVHMRQKSFCVQPPVEGKGFDGSYLWTLQWKCIFLITHHHTHMHICTYICTNTHQQYSTSTKTHTQLSLYSLGNGCLAAETLRALVACLFPPLLLSPLEHYITMGRRKEEDRKRGNLLAVDTPSFPPHLSIPLSVVLQVRRYMLT